MELLIVIGGIVYVVYNIIKEQLQMRPEAIGIIVIALLPPLGFILVAVASWLMSTNVAFLGWILWIAIFVIDLYFLYRTVPGMLRDIPKEMKKWRIRKELNRHIANIPFTAEMRNLILTKYYAPSQHYLITQQELYQRFCIDLKLGKYPELFDPYPIVEEWGGDTENLMNYL